MSKVNSRLFAGLSVALSATLILGAFAVVWLVPRDAAPAAAQATGEQPARVTTVTVRGTGTIYARPDAIVMNVGISQQGSTVAEAQTRVTSTIEAMTERIKAAGVEDKDFRTSQYSVEPVMDYGVDKGGSAQTPRLIGFRVVNILEVTLRDTSKAANLLDSLVEAGANTVYNVGYIFSDPDALSDQAYDKAVKNAEVQAQRLAGLSGMQLGKIVSVSEASAGVPGPIYDKAAGMGGGAAGPIYPGQQSVSVDVIVTYEATAK